MFYAMLALIDEGDEVIYPNPGFPIYESMTEYVGGVAVAAPLREERDFRMDVDEVASLVTPRTRMIVSQQPAQPDRLGPHRGRRPGHRRDRASATTSWSWPMRSTAGSSTRGEPLRSPPCPAWRTGRSRSTASRRPSP